MVIGLLAWSFDPAHEGHAQSPRSDKAFGLESTGGVELSPGKTR